MKVKIEVSFTYGGWTCLLFNNLFYDFPCAPMYGMSIIFDSEKEYSVTLENTENCITSINYDLEKNMFVVYVRVFWKPSFIYREELVPEILEMYSSWERKDTTDLEALVKLMTKK